ncbi:pyridoxamine 5'-phosphate oxidase family protein [Oleidesulfovibrio sp.]|uniref:pyridoxamine 5'-phosphate oxidase family protein n=1 Tax=Oleidesulfovibrio sp. TaxID=2909707 RepID=UPI003A8B28B8
MRLHKRETTSPESINAILAAGSHCIISMVAPDGSPYAVPVNYGHDGTSLFFHCALEGKKLEILTANPAVWVTVVSHMQFDDGGPTAPACKATSAFSSLMASGTAHVLTDEKERSEAMRCILRHFNIEDRSLSDMMRVTALVRIDLTDICTKERPLNK